MQSYFTYTFQLALYLSNTCNMFLKNVVIVNRTYISRFYVTCQNIPLTDRKSANKSK